MKPSNIAVDDIAEAHFAPEELGKLWGLSPDSIRRLFEREPGVLVIERARTERRRYRTLRIPESVAQRVHHRLSNPVRAKVWRHVATVSSSPEELRTPKRRA